MSACERCSAAPNGDDLPFCRSCLASRKKMLLTVARLIETQRHAETVGNRECSPEAHAAEIRALAAKAAQLMREYRIEHSEVSAQAAENDFRDYGLTLIQVYATPDGEVPWQAFLYNIIAESQACQCVVIRENGHFLVAGATLDRAITCALSAAVAQSIDRISLEKWQDAKFHDPAVYLGRCSREEYETSFRTGFMQALQERLREEEQEALMVIKNAVTKTSKFLAIKMGQEPPGTVDVEIELRHRGAAEEGYAAGMQADLNVSSRITRGAPVTQKEIGT